MSDSFNENTKPLTFGFAREIFPADTPRAPGDWFPFAELIAELIRSLFSGCAPTPVDAEKWINWKPYPMLDWWGMRLRRHHDGIRTMVARKWHGPRSKLKEAQEKVIEAVIAGKVKAKLLEGLYSENV